MSAFLLLLLLLQCVAAQWTKLANESVTQPGKLREASAAYSQTLDLFVMFSGLNDANQFQNTVSIYSFATDQWERFTNLSPAPQARRWSTLTLLRETSDVAQFVLLGGYFYASEGVTYNSSSTELWTLVVERNDTTTIKPKWQLLNVTSDNSPGMRSLHQTVNRRGKLYTFGGNRFGRTTPYSDDYVVMDDFWELTPNDTDNITITDVSWQAVPKPAVINDSAAEWPLARFGYGMSVVLSATNNPQEDTLVLYSGRRRVNTYIPDVWLYSFAYEQPRWQRMNIDGESTYNNNPLPRSQGAYYIASDGTVVSFGGVAAVMSTGARTYHQTLNQILLAKYNGVNTSCASQRAVWCTVETSQGGPSQRYNFAWAVRPQTGDLIVYGGATFASNREVSLDGLWLLSLTDVKQLPLLVAKDPSMDNEGLFDLTNTVYFMVAVLVLVLSFFMFIVIMRKRGWQQRTYVPGPVPGQHIQPVGARAHIVSALPRKPYSEMNDLEGQHSTCAICFDMFEPETEVRVLKCDHFFHPACVDEWLAKNNNCPMCKAVVDEEAEAQRFRSTHATLAVLAVAPAPSPSPENTRDAAVVEMTEVVPDDVPAAPASNNNNNPDSAQV